jgi:hypothetical protein
VNLNQIRCLECFIDEVAHATGQDRRKRRKLGESEASARSQPAVAGVAWLG